ncbi:ParB N-terminal domain-containing protein [Palleronia aestuarii]|uniref:ParB N-terminal domain-containing protein n=1 Tax=Palleronia aestuarii TaxID=568105 RepID=UPI001474A7CD|nr:ParB N-terminal domain-containing protein [Palleronia aestuarii]
MEIVKLRVDDAYQRGLGPANWKSIRRIAGDFRWSRFTPVLCAPVPGGLFAIIDGQHRTHAALMCGIEAVPCMVVHMSVAEQASSFSWVNGNVTAISQLQIYKAALAAREPWAIASRAAVEEAGCRLMTSNRSNTQKRAGEIYTVPLIRSYIEAGCEDVVVRGLRAIRRADEVGDPAFYLAGIVKPWLAVVAEAKAPTALLERFCRAHSLVEISEQASALRKRPEYRGKTLNDLTRASMLALLRQFAQGAAA